MPKTLDEALAVLADVRQRLDRLEAEAHQPDYNVTAEPSPDPAPEIDM